MNRHQVITGAVNCGDHCYAVGTVEGVNFTAYATGNDVVILSSDFQRVQIITGTPAQDNISEEVACLDCSSDTGKIAACRGSTVHIYEPAPVFHRASNHRLDYQWTETALIQCLAPVHALSWNQEGTRLLIGGQDTVQMWAAPVILEDMLETAVATAAGTFPPQSNGFGVSFSLGENDGQQMDRNDNQWKEIWQCRTAVPVAHIQFSPDGRLFASVAKGDRLVKVWYQGRKLIFPNAMDTEVDNQLQHDLEYSFVYLPHPRAVTNFSWRKTSRYMPKGGVANMLLTSSLDNISRLWMETALPDDGLLNIAHLQQFQDSSMTNGRLSAGGKYRRQRHKHKFVERFRYMRKAFKKANIQRDNLQVPSVVHHELREEPPGLIKEPQPNMPSSMSNHDLHRFGVHGTAISPECHFHLALSINADTDIPLVPLLSATSGQPMSFVIHWLNNKDMNFTWQAEKLLHELCKKALRADRADDVVSPDVMDEEDEDMMLEAETPGSVHSTVQTPLSATVNRSRSGKKKPGTFNSIRKKIRMPRNKSHDLFEESETMSVTSTSNHRREATPATQRSISVAGSNTGESNGSTPGDTLERDIDNLVRYWHKNADLLFSIHPLDGSFLVWLVEWLDEEGPGMFRQPHVSFASRIPHALPLGDAVTACSNLEVYFTHSSYLDVYSMLKLSDDRTALWRDSPDAVLDAPTVSMISCHQNGSLNMWKVNFSDAAEFSTVVSLNHSGRVCGHRFSVNDMVSHPVLPLLLTTSHHNRSTHGVQTKIQNGQIPVKGPLGSLGQGLCSELILWKVEPVGPLSKSGGITELARINSPELSAFSDCAWIPTLLPPWTLGNLSQASSACFVASDGQSLRIFQAVIDAQLLLAHMYADMRKPVARSDSMISSASSLGDRSEIGATRDDSFNIVSLQSGIHPGCILALDTVIDAKHNWHNTQFLHIYSENVLRGKTELTSWIQGAAAPGDQLESVVDLSSLTNFEETFYLTVMEKNEKSGGSLLHMWSIRLSCRPSQDGTPPPDIDHSWRPESALSDGEDPHQLDSAAGITTQQRLTPANMKITTQKVGQQLLPLTPDVEVVHATPAAGHLSSSAIYPATYAPYLLATACSDGTVRFWRCQIAEEEPSRKQSYVWEEWRTMLGHSSSLTVPGKILGLSCAFSARIACAYKASVDYIRQDRENSAHQNITVAVFECESTGGSEWVQEDKIAVRAVQFAAQSTASPLPDAEESFLAIRREKQSVENLSRYLSGHENFLPNVPSMQCFRKTFGDCQTGPPGRQKVKKQSVTLDWVSTEDGSHVLTVALGSQIMIFAAVSSDIAQQNMKAMAEAATTSRRAVLRQASSFAAPPNKGLYRWMRIRLIVLDDQSGAPAVPNQLTWVRTGLLVLGMDNEMYVYSQWKSSKVSQGVVSHQETATAAAATDARDLADYNLLKMGASPSRMKVTKTLPSLMSTTNLTKRRTRGTVGKNLHSAKDGTGTDGETVMVDRGLFEAARMASPVLPQYHPKQLTELLNFGRLRRVQAILAHLLRCIKSSMPAGVENGPETLAGDEELDEDGRRSGLSRQLSLNRRRKSVLLTPTADGVGRDVPMEDYELGYIEIDSIPPLPLFALFQADNYTGQRDEKEDYGALFDSTAGEEELSLDDVLDSDEGYSPSRKKSRHGQSPSKRDIFAFGPREAKQLVSLLTHMHLPGVSSQDQMHLLALADTVANCTGSLTLDDQSYAGEDNQRSAAENVDACGLRYLLAVRQHLYVLRCMPEKQRTKLKKQGIDSSYIAWAFHSENHQELLQAVTSIHRDELKWTDIRQLGLVWWLKNNAAFKTLIEKLAKNMFQASQEPLDAALFYLAMKRKNVLAALFKLVRNDRMIEFFGNDFKEDRWRKAALKNAFALLGKQRFEHAAAFFLLAGAIKDAVDIIMTKLHDVQLALAVVRLYEGDDFGTTSPHLIHILKDYVIEGMGEEGHLEEDTWRHDPFLKSMAHWMLREYEKALQTLLDEDNQSNGGQAEPGVFNFYDFLRNHPIVLRQVTEAGAKVQKRDTITSVERRLFFKTANVYFRAGCPQLALEVLCKLPEFVIDGEESADTSLVDGRKEPAPAEEVQNFDWGTPATGPSKPKVAENTLQLDWSDDNDDEDQDEDTRTNKSESKQEEKRRKSEDSAASQEPANAGPAGKRTDIMAQQLKFIASLKLLTEELATLATGMETDGGQLRFVLYMWLEKEVEILRILTQYNGQRLHSQLQQMHLKASTKSLEPSDGPLDEEDDSAKLAAHQVLMADSAQFDIRMQRVAKRKAWLRQNQQLLRSLIHFCQIYGANGGGLASVYMELAVLAHELHSSSLQQQQQLLTPLPLITTLPLLSAFLSGPMTISSDPVKFVYRMARDLLKTIGDWKTPPLIGRETGRNGGVVYIIRDISVALSACIYQSLCDSETTQAKAVHVPSAILEGFAETLLHSGGFETLAMQGRRRRNTASVSDTSPRLMATSQPSKWPGVQSLRALLARERDDNSPKLHILLVEALVAVYMSLLTTGLALMDANLLYRLVAVNFNVKTWSTLFGGAARKVIRTATVERKKSEISSTDIANVDRQRYLLNAKVLAGAKSSSSGSNWTSTALGGRQVPTPTPAVPSETGAVGAAMYREVFVPPESSMVHVLIKKPVVDRAADPPFVDYDSEDSLSADEDEQDGEDDRERSMTEMEDEVTRSGERQHSDGQSYSWSLLRLVIVKAATRVVQQILTTVSLDTQDLPVASPALHLTLKTLDNWQNGALHAMEQFDSAPEHYIPSTYGGLDETSAKKNPYSILLQPDNTPFQSDQPSALPVKRLWCYLIHQEYLQETFVKYMFRRKRPVLPSLDTISEFSAAEDGQYSSSAVNREAIRIVHKDQDIVTAFAVNRANPRMLVLSTAKDIQELSISALLDPEDWLEDEAQFNMLTLKNQGAEKLDPEFLVLQTPSDRAPLDAHSRMSASPITAHYQVSTRGAYVLKAFNAPGCTNPHYANYVVGRSAYMMRKTCKRPIKEVRRLAPHPMLPYYLSGAVDGIVRLWEFGHPKELTVLRPTASLARINHLEFSSQGNKFAACDADGVVSFWQLATASGNAAPYISLNCHNKTCSAFTFVGSSSLIATAGLNSESRNVALWDTLLPPRKALVASFVCHDTGSPALVYASQHNMLITCGKRGDVCLFDIRQRQLRHKFQAHDSAIRAIALDPTQEFFVTGSAEGDIKVWGLNVHGCLLSLPEEHNKQSFFRNSSNGVMQLDIDNHNRLFSCGADGFFKIRSLHPSDYIVQTV